MRRASMQVAVLFLVSMFLKSGGQSSQANSVSQPRGVANQEAAAPPQTKGTVRPKLSMQDGLKIAEGYINKQHIDISSYWLYRAIFILYGDNNSADHKIPCWHFWWTHDSGAMGDYVEILVDMEGRAWRVPSM